MFLCRKCNEKMNCEATEVYPKGVWICSDSDCGYQITYPEFLELATTLAADVLAKIKVAPPIESQMPYQDQFILELVIELLQERV